MTDDEARELLIAAGVADTDIDSVAIAIASAVGDVVIKRVAERAAERIVADFFGEHQSRVRDSMTNA